MSNGLMQKIFTLSVPSLLSTSHLKPFYHHPTYVVPLNIAVKDTNEHVVDQIVGHNISDPSDTQCRVRWAGYEASDDTWEPRQHQRC